MEDSESLFGFMDFDQLSGEPSEAYQLLLAHRDFGPRRSYRQTALVVECSESTLRRLAGRWDWVGRLSAYDEFQLRIASLQGASDSQVAYRQSLHAFREVQQQRAVCLARLADQLMDLAGDGLHVLASSDVKPNFRELPAIFAAATKAMEASLSVQSLALGVGEYLESLR